MSGHCYLLLVTWFTDCYITALILPINVYYVVCLKTIRVVLTIEGLWAAGCFDM